jgi:hypothetical protein
MNEAATSLPEFDSTPERGIRFSARLLAYCGVWLLVALAFQFVLPPDGLTETDLSPIQQRIRWPLYTPIMAAVGLAQAATWPDFPGSLAVTIATAVFVVHAVAALTRSSRPAFVGLIFAQAVLLGIAVIYFIRHTQLPTTG